MCGIAGIVGLVGNENRRALRRMMGAMVHRGPDGEGVWEATPDARGWGPMLGHRRLSILDLSPAGAQPMIDPATNDVVVLNGEIYNYMTLRQSLKCGGSSLTSSGDTAVLLRTLATHGTEGIPKLRGMFAFAFWDTSERTLLLARDPFGMKPLYVAANDDTSATWSLVFASEVRALMASGLLGKPKLNPDAVASIVWNGFTVAPETAVRGIFSMSPGEFRLYRGAGDQDRSVRFWSASAQSAGRRTSEADIARCLQESTHLHLLSDAPLAMFLSGGIDSSAVANLASRASSEPINTFTLAFEEAQHDEGVHARRIAEAIGSRHRQVVLSQKSFIGHLNEGLDSLDQPSFDGLNSYFMSRAVREAGFKVALVGSGGDELFGGYTSFRDLPVMLQWARRCRAVPVGLRVAIVRLLAPKQMNGLRVFPPQTRWAKLPDMVGCSEDLIALYQLAYALFVPASQDELIDDPASVSLKGGLPDALASQIAEEVQGRSILSAISVLEQRLFLGERLLRDADSTSMANSIELRLPLVDHVLWEQIDRLPDRDRYFPVRMKLMLRRIGLKGLDPMLFDRPKSGFELPYNLWLKAALGNSVAQTLGDEQLARMVGLNPVAVARLWRSYLEGAPGLYWTRVWALYVLMRWCERNGVYV